MNAINLSIYIYYTNIILRLIDFIITSYLYYYNLKLRLLTIMSGEL
jgi:hypothetical protein